MSYKVFVRDWWRDNPSWPNGLEPDAGKKTILGNVRTKDEAIRMCRKYNATHKPGRYLRKAEFMEV